MDKKEQYSIDQERKRLFGLLESAGVAEQHRETLDAIIDNLAWQRYKLDEARQLIKSSGIVIKYDNGGGQSGVRENPAYKAYGALWRGYMDGVKLFSSYLPKEIANAEEEAAVTVLDQVKKMKKVGA